MPLYELATLEYMMYQDILAREAKEVDSAQENAGKDDKKPAPSPRAPDLTDNDILDMMEEEGLV